MTIAFRFVYKKYPNLLLSAIKKLKTLSAEARCTIIIQAISRSTATHRNCTDVQKVVTPTSRPYHHFDRPELPITIKPQGMPWCMTLCRLLAIPKLQNSKTFRLQFQL
jgi:hypothetical protein